MNRILLAATLLLVATYSQADTTTYEWSSLNDFSNVKKQLADGTWQASNTNLLTSISAWATVEATESNKVKLESQNVDHYIYSGSSNYAGIGIKNSNDEDYEHSIDNYNCSYGVNQEFVLLTFSEAVSLEAADVGWAMTSSNNTNNLKIGFGAVDAGKVNNGALWGATELDGHIFKASSDSKSGTGYYAVGDNSNEASTHWIVGMYQEICDWGGFKLKGIKASHTASVTNVPEPASLAMFALGLVLLFRKQKQSKSFKLSA